MGSQHALALWNVERQTKQRPAVFLLNASKASEVDGARWPAACRRGAGWGLAFSFLLHQYLGRTLLQPGSGE